MPAKQALQALVDTAPRMLLKLPAGHDEQSEELIDPVNGRYVPAAHFEHTALPGVEAYEPFAHDTQVLIDDADVKFDDVPAAQILHV